MDMTKFKDKDDPEFQAVSGQLWIWTNEIEESAESMTDGAPDIDSLRTARDKRFGTMKDIRREGDSVFASQINSGRGNVFQGNPSAEGDFTLNM